MRKVLPIFVYVYCALWDVCTFVPVDAGWVAVRGFNVTMSTNFEPSSTNDPAAAGAAKRTVTYICGGMFHVPIGKCAETMLPLT